MEEDGSHAMDQNKIEEITRHNLHPKRRRAVPFCVENISVMSCAGSAGAGIYIYAGIV